MEHRWNEETDVSRQETLVYIIVGNVKQLFQYQQGEVILRYWRTICCNGWLLNFLGKAV